MSYCKKRVCVTQDYRPIISTYLILTHKKYTPVYSNLTGHLDLSL